MDINEIKTQIDRVIGDEGNLRIQAWWMNKLLEDILDYCTETIENGVTDNEDLIDLINSKLEPYDKDISDINANISDINESIVNINDSINDIQDKLQVISNENFNIFNEILQSYLVVDLQNGIQTPEGFVRIVSKYDLENKPGICFPVFFRFKASDNYRTGTLVFTDIPEENLQRLDISTKSEPFEVNLYNPNGSLNYEAVYSPATVQGTQTYAWLYNPTTNVLLYLSTYVD